MADKIAKRGVSIFIDGKEVKNSVAGISAEMRKLQAEQKKMTIGADDYVAHGKKIAYLDSLFQEHKANQKAVAQEYKKMGVEADSYAKKAESSISKMANGINKYFAMFTTALAAVTGLTLGLKKFMDMRNELEQSSANLKAITGLDDKSVAWMRQYAKELSTTTTETGIRITATSKEIMDGFTVIGSKRPELLKNKEAMADVTKQALTLAATGVPVETAFDVVTAAMNQFNLTGKDANRIINTIAAGSLEGSAEADSLAGSLKNVGTVANDSNMTLEDTVAMLEVMASKQLLGEEAGTKLRGALLKLKDAGVGYASGEFNVRDALIEVNKQLDSKAGALQRDALLQKVFGAENITAGTILLQNVAAYDKLRVAVTDTDVAMRQARIQTSTISAQLAQAQNRFSELGMELVKNLNPAMLKATNIGNAFMKFFVELPKWVNENKGLLISLSGAMSIYAMWLGVLSLAEKKLSIEKAISTTLTKGRIVADLAWCAVQQTLAGNLKTAQKAMKALNAEMSGNAYIAIGIIIAALTIGIYKLVTAQSAANKAYHEFNVQSSIETSTANQLFEAAKKNLGNKEEHKRIIDKINSVYGQYLGNQLTEKSNLDEIARAQMQVNIALRDKIAIETKETAKADVTKKYVNQQVDLADELRNNISKSKGEALSGIFMEEIQKILEENSSDLEKGYKMASEKLKTQMGSDLRPGNLISLRAYAVSVSKMNKDLSDIDRKFQGFDAKKDLIIYDPTKPKKKVDPTHTPNNFGPGNDDKNVAEKNIDNELLKEQIALKKSYSENLKTKEEYDTGMLALDVKYTTKKRDLYKAGSAEYNKHQDKLYDIDIKRNLDANTAHITSIEDSYKSINDASVAFEQSEKDRLQKELDDKLITQDDYDKKLQQTEELMSQARLNNAVAYAELIRDATFNSEADKKKAVEAATKAVEAANDAYLKAKGKGLKSDGKEEAKRQANLEKLRQQLGLDQEKLGYLKSLTALKAYLKENEATEKQSAEAILAFKKQKAVEYAQMAVNIANGLASFIQASNQAQVDNLEASKQKELKAAGNNSTKREAIEKKYAQKELDLKKKQASANMVIAIAQATAEGALGIAKIWAESGVNPVYAGIMTALLAGITAMQIGAAVAQNDAIQSTTLGYSSGGFTPNVGKYTPTGVIHGGEFVSSMEAVNNPNLRPMLDAIDEAQKNGTVSSLSKSDLSKALNINSTSDAPTRTRTAVAGGNPNAPDNPIYAAMLARQAEVIEKLNRRLDEPFEAYSVISGKKGSFEQTKKYEKLIKNASR